MVRIKRSAVSQVRPPDPESVKDEPIDSDVNRRTALFLVDERLGWTHFLSSSTSDLEPIVLSDEAFEDSAVAGLWRVDSSFYDPPILYQQLAKEARELDHSSIKIDSKCVNDLKTLSDPLPSTVRDLCKENGLAESLGNSSKTNAAIQQFHENGSGKERTESHPDVEANDTANDRHLENETRQIATESSNDLNCSKDVEICSEAVSIDSAGDGAEANQEESTVTAAEENVISTDVDKSASGQSNIRTYSKEDLKCAQTQEITSCNTQTEKGTDVVENANFVSTTKVKHKFLTPEAYQEAWRLRRERKIPNIHGHFFTHSINPRLSVSALKQNHLLDKFCDHLNKKNLPTGEHLLKFVNSIPSEQKNIGSGKSQRKIRSKKRKLQDSDDEDYRPPSRCSLSSCSSDSLLSSSETELGSSPDIFPPDITKARPNFSVPSGNAPQLLPIPATQSYSSDSKHSNILHKPHVDSTSKTSSSTRAQDSIEPKNSSSSSELSTTVSRENMVALPLGSLMCYPPSSSNSASQVPKSNGAFQIRNLLRITPASSTAQHSKRPAVSSINATAPSVNKWKEPLNYLHGDTYKPALLPTTVHIMNVTESGKDRTNKTTAANVSSTGTRKPLMSKARKQALGYSQAAKDRALTSTETKPAAHDMIANDEVEKSAKVLQLSNPFSNLNSYMSNRASQPSNSDLTIPLYAKTLPDNFQTYKKKYATLWKQPWAAKPDINVPHLQSAPSTKTVGFLLQSHEASSSLTSPLSNYKQPAIVPQKPQIEIRPKESSNVGPATSQSKAGCILKSLNDVKSHRAAVNEIRDTRQEHSPSTFSRPRESGQLAQSNDPTISCISSDMESKTINPMPSTVQTAKDGSRSATIEVSTSSVGTFEVSANGNCYVIRQPQVKIQRLPQRYVELAENGKLRYGSGPANDSKQESAKKCRRRSESPRKVVSSRFTNGKSKRVLSAKDKLHNVLSVINTLMPTRLPSSFAATTSAASLATSAQSGESTIMGVGPSYSNELSRSPLDICPAVPQKVLQIKQSSLSSPNKTDIAQTAISSKLVTHPSQPRKPIATYPFTRTPTSATSSTASLATSAQSGESTIMGVGPSYSNELSRSPLDIYPAVPHKVLQIKQLSLSSPNKTDTAQTAISSKLVTHPSQPRKPIATYPFARTPTSATSSTASLATSAQSGESTIMGVGPSYSNELSRSPLDIYPAVPQKMLHIKQSSLSSPNKADTAQTAMSSKLVTHPSQPRKPIATYPFTHHFTSSAVPIHQFKNLSPADFLKLKTYGKQSIAPKPAESVALSHLYSSAPSNITDVANGRGSIVISQSSSTSLATITLTETGSTPNHTNSKDITRQSQFYVSEGFQDNLYKNFAQNGVPPMNGVASHKKLAAFGQKQLQAKSITSSPQVSTAKTNLRKQATVRNRKSRLKAALNKHRPGRLIPSKNMASVAQTQRYRFMANVRRRETTPPSANEGMEAENDDDDDDDDVIIVENAEPIPVLSLEGL